MNPHPVILIVEDNESVAASLALIVESLPGARAIVARHPDCALRLFAGEEKFSALLTDFGLPGMDGLRLIETVRAIPAYAQLPVLMITAGVLPNTIPAKGKPNVVFSKPFSPKEVSRVLASLLA